MRIRPAVASLVLVLACASERRLDDPPPESPSEQAARCGRCHGGFASAAPPPSVSGITAATERPVGAHLAHVDPGPVTVGLACEECHHVPRKTTEPGHLDGETVVFAALARAQGAQPAWDDAAGTCSGVYCHGVTLRAPSSPGPLAWTFQQPPGAERCAFCHGYPPAPPHVQAASCRGCHPGSVEPDSRTIRHPGTHLDGKLDASCDACHGAPPASGAHLAHASFTPSSYGGLTSAGEADAAYRFDCGYCHPRDATRHFDGTVDLELHDATAAGTLKALADPAAAYDRAAGTCSGVYCHSSGQQAPAFATTPGWRSGARVACGGCHGNPPKGASEGPDSPRPNSHVHVSPIDLFLVGGHFGGFPSWWHGGGHGENPCTDPQTGAQFACNASAVTCQACHADTVDATATGPSGFYWLHTVGDFELPGLQTIRCGDCHGVRANAPPAVEGALRPFLHVNGVRDVAFDARTGVALPAGYLDGPTPQLTPATPPLPLWVAPAGLTLQRPFIQRNGETLSVHLADARYDPATRTCSNVACHLEQLTIRWGTPPAPAIGSQSCRACHASLFTP